MEILCALSLGKFTLMEVLGALSLEEAYLDGSSRCNEFATNNLLDFYSTIEIS